MPSCLLFTFLPKIHCLCLIMKKYNVQQCFDRPARPLPLNGTYYFTSAEFPTWALPYDSSLLENTCYYCKKVIESFISLLQDA